MVPRRLSVVADGGGPAASPRRPVVYEHHDLPRDGRDRQNWQLDCMSGAHASRNSFADALLKCAENGVAVADRPGRDDWTNGRRT